MAQHSFGDDLVALRITATSPDRSVTASITVDAGLDIVIDADRIDRHDDASLSRQLSMAVSRAQSDFGSAFDSLLDGTVDRSVTRVDSGPQAVVRQRIRRQCAEVVTTGWSGRGRVRVRFAADGRLKVGLTPGTVAYLRGETRELAAEVVEADRDARRRYREAAAEIRRAHTGRIRQ